MIPRSSYMYRREELKCTTFFVFWLMHYFYKIKNGQGNFIFTKSWKVLENGENVASEKKITRPKYWYLKYLSMLYQTKNWCHSTYTNNCWPLQLTLWYFLPSTERTWSFSTRFNTNFTKGKSVESEHNWSATDYYLFTMAWQVLKTSECFCTT